jgi:hypothetical protein
MASKTRLLDMVKAFNWAETARALDESPQLTGWRDGRGRGWLHLCCAADIHEQGRRAEDSLRTADVLLERGLDINQAAFTEGEWQATPLWYAIAWGRNLALAEHLLSRGSIPNHCLFAAVWNHDLAAIRLLMRAGAPVDEGHEGETAFLGAVAWSRFPEAEELLKAGADSNARNAKGMTALHAMLKKSSAPEHLEMVVRYGARGDIADAEGRTATALLRRKQDPRLRRLAERLSGG